MVLTIRRLRRATLYLTECSAASGLGSPKNRIACPCALQLEKAIGAGDEHDAVPELAGGFALGRRSHDRAEERHAVDRNDGGSDFLTHEIDANLVGSADCVVEFGRLGRLSELERQAGIGKSLLIEGLVEFTALNVVLLVPRAA